MDVEHTSPPRPRVRGISLLEVVAVLAIITITAFFLFPVFAKARSSKRPSQSANLKQVALSLLSYAQDHDDQFPPVSGYMRPLYSDEGKGKAYHVRWGPGRQVAPTVLVPGLLGRYLMADGLFRGTPVEHRGFFGRSSWRMPSKTLGFLYNDLIATESTGRVPGPAQTVLATDGEDQYWNAGHTWLPTQGPFSSVTNAKGKCGPGQGATVRSAPERIRGGAMYAFADGHVKWFKAAYDPSSRTPGKTRTVYFPPWESAAVKADPKKGEPVPGGDMRGWAATFHVR